MVEIEYIQPKAFVWWKGEGCVQMRDCPCVVSRISEEKTHFRVISMEDLKETQWLRLHDEEGEHAEKSRRHEMRPCTSEEVEKYLTEKIEHLQGIAKKAQQEADEFKKKSEEFFRKSVLEQL